MPVNKTVYVSFTDVNQLQQDIMQFIEWWVHNEKTPIPLKEIIKKMKEKNIKEYTTVFAINSLLRKGYIRRAIMGTEAQNRTKFVQLRRVV